MFDCWNPSEQFRWNMEVLFLFKFFLQTNVSCWAKKKVNKDLGGLNIFEIIFQPLALAIHFPSFPPLLIPQRPLRSQSRLLGPGTTQPFNIVLCKWNLARRLSELWWCGYLLTRIELCHTFYKEIFGETRLYMRQAPILPWSQPELKVATLTKESVKEI